MADIDILLAVRGQRQSVEGLSKVQESVLRMQESVSKGASAVTAFDGVWREFNETGSVSVSTIASLASALPGLASPASAATAAIGLLVAALLRAQKAQKELAAQAFKAEVEGLEETSRVQLRIAKETFGQSEEASRLIREKITLEERFNELLQDRARETKRIEEAEKARGAHAMRLDPERVYAIYQTELDKVQRKALETAAALAEVLAAQGQVTSQGTGPVGVPGVDSAPDVAGGTFDYEEWELQRQALYEEVQLREEIARTMREQAEANTELALITEEAAGLMYAALADTAAGAYDVLVDAIDQTIAANRIFSMETAKSLRKVLAEVLRSVGREAAVKYLLNLAGGFAELAVGNVASSTNHFTAAAIYGTTAAYAGIASAALSTGSGSSGAGAGAGGGGGGGLSGASDVSQVFQQVVVIGELDGRGAEDLNAQLAKARESRDLSDF